MLEYLQGRVELGNWQGRPLASDDRQALHRCVHHPPHQAVRPEGRALESKPDRGLAPGQRLDERQCHRAPELPVGPGQITTIDFGNINPSDLVGPGETSPHAITRTFNVQCRNISDSVAIKLSLEGAPHKVQTDALAVNDRSDLAIILKNNGRIVPPVAEGVTPTTPNFIPLDFNQPEQKGQFDLEAHPIKAEKEVEPGEFKSQVTVKFEFE
ncbi:fimbrial protein [Pseudomonas sp. GCM10022186]|uniref:fimbrial protein n=1 Tax=Pseudomonas sp. GCM10022186 TaxID=3252650 RepID=UPI00360A2CB3